MSFIKNWSPYFSSNIRMRGRTYYEAGKIRQMTPREGEVVRAQVHGTRVYEVTIRGEGPAATAHCTCPMFTEGNYCKHIWATLLDVQEHGVMTATESADGPGSVAPPTPKARRRTGERPAKTRSEAEWIGRLSLLRSGPVVEPDHSPQSILFNRRQICYVVSVTGSLSQNCLVIELWQRQPTRAGWSALKPLKINTLTPAELTDPTDRELCALLVGGRPMERGDFAGYFYDENRGAAVFRMPSGGWRPTLRRMIETGRCFIDVSDDRMGGGRAEAITPLRWDGDEAWTLWLTGQASDDELILNLDLRRGEASIDVADPSLILGGPDGLVFIDNAAAPFDDRGAYRWAAQFRDEHRLPGQRPAVKVPAQDIPLFLDRLYQLPQLPEIDLPAEIGRTEEHLHPVPHLELLSPAAAMRLDPAAPRNLLTARAWFNYGSHRVAPGQAGRFVISAPPEDELSNDQEPHWAITSAPPRRYAEVEAEAEEEPVTVEDREESPETTGTGEAGPVARASGPPLIRRDLPKEAEAMSLLLDVGFRPNAVTTGDAATVGVLATRQMPGAVAQLLRAGWTITADRHAIRNPGTAGFSIRSGVDWFELRGGIKYKTIGAQGQEVEQVIGLPEILEAVKQGKQMITLGDGSQGLLPDAWLKSHGMLAAVGEIEGDHLRFKLTQAALLDSLLEQQELIDVDDKFQTARQRLGQFQGIKPVEAAGTFTGSLRHYQQDGVGWLCFLRWFGMGGILADDMGLGKTIQVLAMLDRAYAEHPTNGTISDAGTEPLPPTLIVVPRSVVFNWMDEAQRFTPRLRVIAYTGADRHGLREAFKDHDVIVTSYGLMRRDIAELRKHRFNYIVLDEAQAIKSPVSQGAKAARLLDANHRLALTGTPIENHLGDLWSIFEFLNPGMLGSNAMFAQMIRGSLAGNGPENGEKTVEVEPEPAEPGVLPARSFRNGQSLATASQLSRALRPFILRRTKKQVLTELPDKTEQTIVCEMEPPQRAVYDELLRHYRASLLSEVDRKGLGKSTIMVLEALLRLRQASCHPGLIDPKRIDEPSAKMDVLLDRLSDLIEEGHKALVFSQFTSLLAIVRKRLDERGTVYEYLDGQTRNRRERVQRFQTDPKCPLFLISLKAGGLGLNLTAAEYVFILDPWWNPAVENQAIDRAHRIGQTRHVFAYRLICHDTVEQRIAELQVKKKQLADAIVGADESLLRSLTRDELDRLLS